MKHRKLFSLAIVICIGLFAIGCSEPIVSEPSEPVEKSSHTPGVRIYVDTTSVDTIIIIKTVEYHVIKTY